MRPHNAGASLLHQHVKYVGCQCAQAKTATPSIKSGGGAILLRRVSKSMSPAAATTNPSYPLADSISNRSEASLNTAIPDGDDEEVGAEGVSGGNE